MNKMVNMVNKRPEGSKQKAREEIENLTSSAAGTCQCCRHDTKILQPRSLSRFNLAVPLSKKPPPPPNLCTGMFVPPVAMVIHMVIKHNKIII